MAEQPQVVYVQNKNFLSTLVAMFVAILVSVPLAVMVASSAISKASAQSVDPQSQTTENNNHPNYVYPPCLYDFGTSNKVEQNANPTTNQGGAGSNNSSSNGNGGSGTNKTASAKKHGAGSITNNSTNNINQTTNNTTTNTITGSFNSHSYNGNDHSFNQDSYNEEKYITKTENKDSFNTHIDNDIEIEVDNETHNNYEGIVGSNITTNNDQKSTVDSAVENMVGAPVAS